LGCKNLKRAKELGKASWKIFYQFIENQIAHDVDLIIEGDFQARFDKKLFSRYQNQYNLNITQIICKADIDVVVKRFQSRAKGGGRHPGHHDHLVSEGDFIKGVREEMKPIISKVPTIEVDMNDFDKIDYGKLFEEIGEKWHKNKIPRLRSG
jgi:hypothetical protein